MERRNKKKKDQMKNPQPNIAQNNNSDAHNTEKLLWDLSH